MPKVYIAAAFRRFSYRNTQDKAYGEINDKEYVVFLEKIEEIFLDFGFDTCLPHRDEGLWGKVYYEPAAISSLCFRHVQTSDMLFALAETGRGVHIELGYAAALDDKKIIMMYKEGTEPSTLIFGLTNALSPWKVADEEPANTFIASYSDLPDLLTKIEGILSSKYGLEKTLSSSTRTNTAIIDIGSHTVKLKVLSHRPGSHPKILLEAKQSLGIMGDVIQAGQFSQDTISKVVALLKKWKEECSGLFCDSFIVTGTAALRKSVNTDVLLSRIKDETLLDLEILSPKRELEYVYLGVQSTFKSGTRLAVLNLGGGSTQLGVGDEPSPEEEYLFDFGTRVLTEKWPWDKPMASADYEAMLEYVRHHMQEVIATKPKKVQRMVHTGGELDFMLRCQLPLRVSSLSPIHVSEISVDAFARFSKEFSCSDPNKIAADFGLDPAWASGAVASNVIALCAAEIFGAEAIIPSNLNISDGLLLHNLSVGKAQ